MHSLSRDRGVRQLAEKISVAKFAPGGAISLPQIDDGKSLYL